MSQYSMVLEYRKGKLHVNPDALSRINKTVLAMVLSQLLCPTISRVAAANIARVQTDSGLLSIAT